MQVRSKNTYESSKCNCESVAMEDGCKMKQESVLIKKVMKQESGFGNEMPSQGDERVWGKSFGPLEDCLKTSGNVEMAVERVFRHTVILSVVPWDFF